MKTFKITNKNSFRYILVILGIIIIGLVGYLAYGIYRLNQLTEMTFEDMITYTTRDKQDAIISVGIIKDGSIEYFSYGENNSILELDNVSFEIGSIAKTFTTALLCKAINEESILLDSTIEEYIDLSDKEKYPTIRSLATHTSGYKSFYFEKPMITNFISNRNDYYGISKELLIERLNKISLKNIDYDFRYSNFGIAVLGKVLESIYDKDFVSLMNDYIVKELGLRNTAAVNIDSNIGESWLWKESDAYIPAGAMVSNIKDMTKYLLVHMDDSLGYLSVAHQNVSQGKVSKTHEKMGIRIDAVGLGWMIDIENGFIWHNGGTDNFNSYISFDLNREYGVVILSNLPPDYRIPATIIGIELMKSLKD